MTAAKAIPIVVNGSGGTAAARGAKLRDELAAAFAEAGLRADLRIVAGADVTDAVKAVADAPLVVVGGGDGTLGSAAAVLAGTDTVLGILPLGTRNHLAADLGIADLGGAVGAIADGHVRRIDIARVNDRVFVNNASVGLYPAMVRAREIGQHRHALPKWAAALPAGIAALRRMRHHRLRLTIGHADGASGDADGPVVTPLLFVGNNRYDLDRGSVGSRAALDDGKLSVYAVASRRRLALVGFALRALIGAADPARDFAAIGEPASLTVEGRSRSVAIALDGEVMRLAMPLRFAVDPGALAVVVPREGRTAAG